MFHRCLTYCVVFALTACGGNGSTTETNGAGGTIASGSSAVAFGGATNSMNVGGTTAKGAGGANTPTGGKSSAGNEGGTTAVAGNPCTGICPTGTVLACFGVGCPLGPCDEARFMADDLCSTVYTSPLDGSFPFCSVGQNGSYCLVALNISSSDWVVHCDNGTPTLEKCAGGCGVDSNKLGHC
jgi:hypothetical protein